MMSLRNISLGLIVTILFLGVALVALKSSQSKGASVPTPNVETIHLDNYCSDASLREKYVSVKDCGDIKILSQGCCDQTDIIIDEKGNKLSECGGIAGWSQECRQKYSRANCAEWKCDGAMATDKSLSCQTDNDCGMNICGCIALNKNFIKANDKICTRHCPGQPKCIKGSCSLVP